ncbi:MAG: MATE family efflux transporter, partial [Erysipelotrichaceae bacterium]|nr:MATE family efflux transporter [Erysipelotrichaceae bacterium]
YNLVDRMYIGHIPGTGALSLTGVGVTFPILISISAFAALVCMGSAPRAAIFLGKSDSQMAEKILNQSVTLLIIMAVVLTILAEVFGERLLWMFGASADTIDYGMRYLRIYALGSIFVMLSLGLNAYINTQGYAMFGMLSVGIGAVINIVLDPIFIFNMNLGVEGAAWATILSQCCSAVFCIWFLTSKHSFLKLKPSMMKIQWSVIGPCLLLGSSPFVMQITEAMISVCFNSSLQTYGGDLAVGAMTILTSVMQFSFLPLQGMAQGAQPIVSYNYGAAKYDRIRSCFKILLLICFGFSAALWLLCELAPDAVISMFTQDPALMAYTRTALRIYMGANFLFGIQIACQQTFLALGKAKISLFLACLRKLILLKPT